VNEVGALPHSSWRPGQLPAREQVIVEMLNCLATLSANIAHQTPTAFTVSGCSSEFCSNRMHLGEKGRMFWRVSKISGGANMFARQNQQMEWRLRRNILNGEDEFR
jgi:hypothetical protein